MSRDSSAYILYGFAVLNNEEELDLLKDFAKAEEVSSEEFIEHCADDFDGLSIRYLGTYDYCTIVVGIELVDVDWGAVEFEMPTLTTQQTDQINRFLNKYNIHKEPSYILGSMYG